MSEQRERAWKHHLRSKRSHRNARRSSFDAGFDAALAALTDDEAVQEWAEVLDDAVMYATGRSLGLVARQHVAEMLRDHLRGES